MARMREYHGGRSYDSTFGIRQRGAGTHASLLASRFEQACRRYGLNIGEEVALDTERFERSRAARVSAQMQLL